MRAEDRLARLGPWILVGVGMHPDQAHMLENPPGAVKGRALIDTGASISVVDIRVLEGLGLRPINTIPIRGCSDTASLQAPTFMVRFQFASRDLKDRVLVVVGLPLARKTGDEIALLGRDILRTARFVYDGPAGGYSLEFS